MSLENSFERIAVALESLAVALESYVGAPTSEKVKLLDNKPEETIPPKEEIKSPFDQAVNQQAAETAGPTHTSEFTDNAGLVAYAMKAYQDVGAEKGAKIQGALGTLGYTNINDVKPEHFQGFFDAVETIKRGE